MKRAAFALILLLVALLSGCSRKPTPTATPAPTPRPTSTLAPTPEATRTPAIEPTATPVTPNPTAETTPSPTPIPTAVVRDDGKVYLDDVLLLDPATEAPRCRRVGEISYSPTQEHFLVLLACPEWDNDAFLFKADGSDKRPITGEWDYVKNYNYRWSSDGQSFIYERINSRAVSAAEIPETAPLPGLVRYDVGSGEKTLLAEFRVVNVQSGDVLNVRSGPGVENEIVGALPSDGMGVQITGAGAAIGDTIWVPVRYGALTGWVNFDYLEQQVSP